MRACGAGRDGSAATSTPARPHHGWVAWTLAVLAPSLAALAVHWLLILFVGWPFAVLWSVAVLYVTLGFRQFSHHFTNIRDALDTGDEPRARELLAQWQQVDASELPRSEIVRHVIEYSVLAAHRHVFGVLAWFSVLAAFGFGPAGAVLYRMSEFVGRYWKYRNRTQLQPASAALQSAAARAWHVIDWLPARITALAFAVVGSFEEAIDCWRNYAQRFPERQRRRDPGRHVGSGERAAGGRSAQVRIRAQQLAELPVHRRLRPWSTPRAHRAARPRLPTCAASWGWCGGRSCCGWCCWRC